jgi:hypothetical protein
MGSNYITCGTQSLKRFVELMCSGEKGQIKLLAGFIEMNPALHKAVKEKDWAGIAKNYNGPSYKNYSYDSKMKSIYEKIKKDKSA